MKESVLYSKKKKKVSDPSPNVLKPSFVIVQANYIMEWFNWSTVKLIKNKSKSGCSLKNDCTFLCVCTSFKKIFKED